MKKITKEILGKIGLYMNKGQREEMRQSMNDLLAIQMLPNVNLDYLPWTTAALRPAAVAALLNEIVIHKRSSVLEFGAGISTLYVANLFQKKGDGHITTVEHDEEWAKTVKSYLRQMGVEKRKYSIIKSSICKYKKGKKNWYDKKELKKRLKKEYDMIVVDGPPAQGEKNKEIRYPALPFASNFTREELVIFLDDIGREGETRISRKWKREYELNMRKVAGMGVFRPKKNSEKFAIRV